MAKVVEGIVAFCRFEKADVFNWQDPSTGQMKPLRSLKVLLPHGDGTVSRESISIPPEMDIPRLNPGEIYGFRCAVNLNKKKLTLNWTLVPGSTPLPSLEIE